MLPLCYAAPLTRRTWWRARRCRGRGCRSRSRWSGSRRAPRSARTGTCPILETKSRKVFAPKVWRRSRSCWTTSPGEKKFRETDECFRELKIWQLIGKLFSGTKETNPYSLECFRELKNTRHFEKVFGI